MQEMYYSQCNMYSKGWLQPCGQHPASTQPQYLSCMEEPQNAWSVYQHGQVQPPPPPPPTAVADIWTDDHLTNVPPPHDPPDLHHSLNRVPPARSPYEWMTKPSYQSQPNPGKTRTKDKYRVVYTDHQRLELEKEFHYSRYITIRRKAELASLLSLSERQVKIWFQNRRAKERKQAKKREEMMHKDKMRFC